MPVSADSDSNSETSESMTLHDYGPETFEKAKQETWFIAARGTMPVITDDGEKTEWIDLLISRSGNFPEIEQYLIENGGSMGSFGIGIDGYIAVGFDTDYPEKANESTIDEIYHVIKEHYEKEGIKDVPVVFVWEHIVETGEAPGDLSEEETNENKIEQQAPGFTSPMLILSLLLLMEIKRKLFGGYKR